MQSTTPLGKPEVSTSDREEISFEELVDRANGFAFYTFAYDALLEHGIDFKTLPDFPNLSDAYLAGQLSSAIYFGLLAEALREAVQAGSFVKSPTVPDVGNA